MKDEKVTLGLRLGSMFLDHLIMCSLTIPPFIALKLILNSIQLFDTNSIEAVAFDLIILVYINKDFVGGKSIAKRILGLRIVDRKTGEPANELKCLLRNMTIPFLWPIEVLITLFSNTRRLGDFFANTTVEIADKENPKSILADFKTQKMTSITLLTLLIGIAYMIIIRSIMNGILKI